MGGPVWRELLVVAVWGGEGVCEADAVMGIHGVQRQSAGHVMKLPVSRQADVQCSSDV